MSTSPPALRSASICRPALTATIVLALLMTGLGLWPAPASAAPDDPPTVVSLTFDDGNANQLPAAAIMKAHGMPGTFYVNSGAIGLPGFFTRAQLDTLAADGNEIGGHTLNHTDLPTLPTDEARRQICLDRANLIDWGFAPRSFAYPFASTTTAVRSLVSGCGYNSARNLGDIASRFGCAGCPAAESVPPSEPFETKALDQVDNTWTLDDFKTAVTNAEADGGGWVQFTFHDFCGDVCSELSVSEQIFTDFLDWLQLRQASNNTTVKTVGDVIGGTVKPAVTVPDPVPTTDPSGLTNPGFESVNSAGDPICWQKAPYGNNTPTLTTVSPGRTGNRAGRVVVTNHVEGDGKWLPSLDLGTCAPSAAAGKSYVLRGWYTSTTTTQFAVYLRTTSGGWVYWTTSPLLDASASYTQAVWTTPAVPAGYTGISFGLSMATNGTLTVDDYSISATDAKPLTSVAVTPTIPDGTGGWYVTRPTAALTLETGSTGAVRQYSFDGTTWTNYTAPISIPDGTNTLSYRSKTSDTVVEDTKTIVLKVDTVKPVVLPTFDKVTRKVDATATEATSGPAQIEKREGDGPWAAFVGPLTMGDAGAAMEFRATDAAGNVSAIVPLTVPAALISSATVSPATPNGADGWYTSKPTVTLTKVSGAASSSLQYSIDDGPWAAYTAPVQISDGTHSLRYRVVDGDDTETAHELTFKVDTVKPVVTPTFNKSTRALDATASDATSQTALIERRLGSGPWTPHTGPISINDDAASYDFRATDHAGNVSDVVNVDIAAALISSATISPATPDGTNDWYVSTPTLTLTKISGASSAHLEYSIDGGDWTTYSAPVDVPNGTPAIRYRTVDGDDTEPARTINLKVDTTAPIVDPTFDKSTRLASASAADDVSAIDRIERRLPGGDWATYSDPFATGDDAVAIEFRAVDRAGNVSAVKVLNVPDRQSTPTVVLSLSKSSTTYGKAIKVTVAVPVPSGSPTATGVITVLVDGKAAGKATLTGGRATVTLAKPLSVKTHKITATYAGDGDTKPGSATAKSLKITKASTKASLTLSSSKGTAKKSRIKVYGTVTVPGTTVKATGRLYVMVNGKVVKKLTLKSGKASYRLPKFKQATKVKISVKYIGSSNLKADRSSSKSLRIRS